MTRATWLESERYRIVERWMLYTQWRLEWAPPRLRAGGTPDA